MEKNFPLPEAQSSVFKNFRLDLAPEHEPEPRLHTKNDNRIENLGFQWEQRQSQGCAHTL